MQKNRRLLFEYVDLKGAVSSQASAFRGLAFKTTSTQDNFLCELRSPIGQELRNLTTANPMLPVPMRHVPTAQALSPQP